MKAAIDLKNSVRKRIKTTLQQSKEALFLWRTKPLKRWLNWGVGGTVKKNPVFQGLLWTLTSLISIPEIGCWQFRMIATKHLVRMSSLLSDFFLPPGSKTSFFSFLNFVVYELCKVFRLNQMKTRWKKKKKRNSKWVVFCLLLLDDLLAVAFCRNCGISWRTGAIATSIHDWQIAISCEKSLAPIIF